LKKHKHRANPLDRNISAKLTQLYILALTAVAFFAVFGQSAVQYALSKQVSASAVVNIAGRQRMLSQRICKDLLLITTPSNNTDKSIYIEDLEEFLPLWKTCHEGLKRGVLLLDTKIVAQNSEVLDSMIADIDPIFYKIYNNATKIKEQIDRHSYTPDDSIRAFMQIVLDNERRFLFKQDKIVFQYDTEAKARVEKLKTMEFTLLALTIIVLVLEGFFVFRPAAKQIRQTIKMLLREENKTKRINQELYKVNRSLKKAEIELVNAEKEKHQHQVNAQRIRSATLIQGQEEERNRISKELHDGLGQLLTTLKLTFENMNNNSFASEKEKKTFYEGKELIQETIDEVRNISFNLMPSVLSDFGIASALKSLCYQAARNTDIEIDFEDSNWIQARLDKNIEIGLYRIAQEALNNAIKYSESDEITIELALQDDIIELSIIDYGKGFLLHTIHNNPMLDNRRNGLSNMEERAEMIGGTLEIISNPEQGTKVYAKVPLKYPLHEK